MGVDEAKLAQIVVQRLTHWRTLLEKDAPGLGEATLRGLIGELLILRDRLVPNLSLSQAVGAWRGPLGAPQDFVMPDGHRLEIKTVGTYADTAQIHGLNQLDASGDPLTLVIVRTEGAPTEMSSTLTAPRLIQELRNIFSSVPDAQADFDAALNGLGWHDHPSHEGLGLRIIRIEEHDVGPDFPKLLRANVPAGVLDADYIITLPNRQLTRMDSVP